VRSLEEVIKTCEIRLANPDMSRESRDRERDVWHHLKQYEALREVIMRAMKENE
jgi:hypothetical protein